MVMAFFDDFVSLTTEICSPPMACDEATSFSCNNHMLLVVPSNMTNLVKASGFDTIQLFNYCKHHKF